MSETTISIAGAGVRPPLLPTTKVLVRKSQGRPAAERQPPSREAQRCAAVILEVLAGIRTPTDAATVLGIALPRYYLWEQRALDGLVRACEPRPAGQAASQRHQIAVLEKEVARLRQECARHQALVRASQRTIGLTPLPAPKPVGKATGKTTTKVGHAKARKRRPVVRALKAVAALLAVSPPENVPDSSSAAIAEVLQPCGAGSAGIPPAPSPAAPG